MSAWEPASAVVAWIEDALGRGGGRVVRITPMPISGTEKHVIDVEWTNGRTERLVLRRYHDAERLGSDPWYVPANEARALELLEGTAVPAPRLVAADLEAEICGVPALLETWVAGEQAWQPDSLDAYLTSAAEILVRIHAIAPLAGTDLPAYLPYFADDDRAHELVPRWSAHVMMWERVFALIDGPWPVTHARFIHRDYHPGNALWDGSQVSGVVDWATAARGPSGIDLARMRQNLAGWHGTAVADRFATRYVEAGGDPAARDPFWALLDAADSVADRDEPCAPGEGDFDLFEDFVARVLSEL